MDGSRTFREDFADNSGIRLAFQVSFSFNKKLFQSFQKLSSAPSQALPGLDDFTDNQLFFLAFGNVKIP